MNDFMLAIIEGILGDTIISASRSFMSQVVRSIERESREKGDVKDRLGLTVKKTYLMALISICKECRNRRELENAPSSEIRWLYEKELSLSKALRNKASLYDYPDFSPVSTASIIINGNLSLPAIQELKEQILLHIIEMDSNAPKCYFEEVCNSIFERISVFLAIELKYDEDFYRFFQNSILAEMDQKMYSSDKTLNEIKSTLINYSGDVSSIAVNIQRLEDAIAELKLDGLNIHIDKIFHLVTSTSVDVQDIKKQLLILGGLGGRLPVSGNVPVGCSYLIVAKVIEPWPQSRIYIPLTGKVIIGRRDGSTEPDIAFEDPRISRMHAIIEPNEDGFMIKDIGMEGNGSKNGTWLNGIMISPAIPCKLTHGDEISLANDTVIFLFCDQNPGTI